MNSEKYPNPPGHPLSVADGCTCPIMDNGHGAGSGYIDKEGNPVFYFNYECPLHGNTDEALSPEDVCYKEFTEASPYVSNS